MRGLPRPVDVGDLVRRVGLVMCRVVSGRGGGLGRDVAPTEEGAPTTVSVAPDDTGGAGRVLAKVF